MLRGPLHINEPVEKDDNFPLTLSILYAIFVIWLELNSSGGRMRRYLVAGCPVLRKETLKKDLATMNETFLHIE